MSYGDACLMVELFVRRSVRQERVCSFMESGSIYDELWQVIEDQGLEDRVEACFANGSLWLMKKGV